MAKTVYIKVGKNDRSNRMSISIKYSYNVGCRFVQMGRGICFLAGLLLFSLQMGCVSTSRSFRIPQRAADAVYTVEATGYCACADCCGWVRNWYGRPVYASGSLKGHKKAVGQTASGTRAQPGTIAADTTYFPMETILYVPGYGYGRVEDRGGAIKGAHIDLFYHSHRDALQWGRRAKVIHVWYPPR
jgi:3D (Asp-Asp-Asp) domain-containing protein